MDGGNSVFRIQDDGGRPDGSLHSQDGSRQCVLPWQEQQQHHGYQLPGSFGAVATGTQITDSYADRHWHRQLQQVPGGCSPAVALAAAAILPASISEVSSSQSQDGEVGAVTSAAAAADPALASYLGHDLGSYVDPADLDLDDLHDLDLDSVVISDLGTPTTLDCQQRCQVSVAARRPAAFKCCQVSKAMDRSAKSHGSSSGSEQELAAQFKLPHTAAAVLGLNGQHLVRHDFLCMTALHDSTKQSRALLHSAATVHSTNSCSSSPCCSPFAQLTATRSGYEQLQQPKMSNRIQLISSNGSDRACQAPAAAAVRCTDSGDPGQSAGGSLGCEGSGVAAVQATQQQQQQQQPPIAIDKAQSAATAAAARSPDRLQLVQQQQQHGMAMSRAASAPVAGLNSIGSSGNLFAVAAGAAAGTNWARQQQQPVTLAMDPAGLAASEIGGTLSGPVSVQVPQLPPQQQQQQPQLLPMQLARGGQQQQQPVQLLGPFTVASVGELSLQSGVQPMVVIQQEQQQRQQQQLLQLQLQQLQQQQQQRHNQQLQILQHRQMLQQQQLLQQQQHVPSMSPERLSLLLRDIAPGSSSIPSVGQADMISPEVYARAHVALQQRLQAAYQAGFSDGIESVKQQSRRGQRQRQQQGRTLPGSPLPAAEGPAAAAAAAGAAAGKSPQGGTKRRLLATDQPGESHHHKIAAVTAATSPRSAAAAKPAAIAAATAAADPAASAAAPTVVAATQQHLGSQVSTPAVAAARSAPVLSELLASDRNSAAARLRNMSDTELLLLAAQAITTKPPLPPPLAPATAAGLLGAAAAGPTRGVPKAAGTVSRERIVCESKRPSDTSNNPGYGHSTPSSEPLDSSNESQSESGRPDPAQSLLHQHQRDVPAPGPVPGQRGVPGQHGAPGQRGAPGQWGAPDQRGAPGQQGVPGQQGAPGQQVVTGQRGAPGQQTLPDQRPPLRRSSGSSLQLSGSEGLLLQLLGQGSGSMMGMEGFADVADSSKMMEPGDQGPSPSGSLS